MFGYFIIFLIICFLISLFFYFKLKKQDDEFSHKKMLIHTDEDKKLKTGKFNEMKDHLALALLEREKILNTNGLLPGSNNSICYGLDGKKIKGCKCHPTCKTCGYGKDPKGMNQCLTCINGSDVNSLYNNGAGWCSIENSKKPSMIRTKTGQNVECNDKILEVCGLKNKYDNNGDFSGWDKCLKENEKTLLMHGCQFDKDYKIKASEPYKCGECIRVYNPNSDNKDIGGQKCCSGGEKCYMRRCSVSAETQKSTESQTTSSGGTVGKNYHYRYNFSTLEVTENNTTTNDRTINVKIIFSKEIPAKSQITISNLAGVSTTKNTRLKINVTSPNKPKLFGSTTLNPRSDSVGSWDQTNGYLVLKVSDDESIDANEEIKFSFDLQLKNSSPGGGTSPEVSLLSGDDKYKILPTKLNTSIFVRNVNGGSGTSKGGSGAGSSTGASGGASSGAGTASATAPSSGYCMDLGFYKSSDTPPKDISYNIATIKDRLVGSGGGWFSKTPNCTGDYTLAVKNEFQCDRITDSFECDSNKTCNWNESAPEGKKKCSNDYWNKWFCSKPKDKCPSQWSSVPGFFGVDA